MEKMQETVNRTVLSKIVRIVSVPNPDGLGLREIVKKFLEDVILYENNSDPEPLGWIRSAGNNNNTSSFRAEMSSSFWNFYLEKGRKNLMDYNRRNQANIKLIRGQTVKVGDIENLSLYLRKKIRKYCSDNKLKVPDVLVKNGYVTIKYDGKENKTKCTELAVLLGWNYEDWNGTPIKDLLSEDEMTKYRDGRLVWGSFNIESMVHDCSNLEVHHERRNMRKRGNESSEYISQKLARKEE
ncbi:hypothetical protein V3C99_013501 [Haemonchus contortus]